MPFNGKQTISKQAFSRKNKDILISFTRVFDVARKPEQKCVAH